MRFFSVGLHAYILVLKSYCVIFFKLSMDIFLEPNRNYKKTCSGTFFTAILSKEIIIILFINFLYFHQHALAFACKIGCCGIDLTYRGNIFCKCWTHHFHLPQEVRPVVCCNWQNIGPRVFVFDCRHVVSVWRMQRH